MRRFTPALWIRSGGERAKGAWHAIRPENQIQDLCWASAVVGSVLTPIAVMFSSDSQFIGGGLAMGLYAAARYIWMTDEDTVIA
jgi:lipid-A-disaccharide synthase-like uncharacterized protein